MISPINSNVIDAFSVCRGKVFHYKQQLLSRFSNDYVPVQYGVDYSSKVNTLKVQPEIIPNKNIEVKPTIACETSEKFPDTSPRKHETYETVSKIQFQKSPPVNRKVILISKSGVKHNEPEATLQSIQSDKTSKISSPEKLRPEKLNLAEKPEILKEDIILGLKSPVDKNTWVKEYIGNQLSPVSEPEDICCDKEKDINKRFYTSKKTDRYSNQAMKNNTVDPSLVTVAQRAKSLMSNKPNQSTLRSGPVTTIDVKLEGTDESLLSIKDRIRLFKDNVNQSVSTSSSERPVKHVSNRYKTQPLSFDDIARANALILDQSDVASTIASPSITNSNETLVDFSEDSNSSSNKNTESHKQSIKLKKSNAILRAQSCLINNNQNIQKPINEEELVPLNTVKDIIKNCDKKETEILQQKFPKNAVVSRKLAFKNRTDKEENIKSAKIYAKKSHLTQPITKIDMENSNFNSDHSNPTIQDRISKMKNCGENNWKSRIAKDFELESKPRPGSVAISSLQEKLLFEQDNWKHRVDTKDAKDFTVSNKLEKSLKSNNSKRYTIHGRPVEDFVINEKLISRLTKSNQNDGLPPKQKIISDVNLDDLKSNWYIKDSSDNLESNNSEIHSDTSNNIQSHKVTVPKISDQSLSNFFQSSSPDNATLSSYKPTNDDFDDIFLQTDFSLSLTKRNVKPSRNQRVSRNPIKKLNERTDIKDEYDETLTGVAERELKRCRIENIQSKVGLAEEALAALSTKEDFSKIKLKRTESSKNFEQFVSPLKDLMLISIKGRKNIQLRLVEPTALSINDGDCYLLLTENHVYIWLGEFANVIENNKANELGSWIAKRKDLNYKGSSDKPIIVQSSDSETNPNNIQFWKYLNYDKVQEINPPGDEFEDELYERLIQRTNIVYQVKDNQLYPLDEYWGSPLKHKMLKDDEVYIFDFGSELYLWSGNKADMKNKISGKHLLKILYSKGYNYEDCVINPLDPLPNSSLEAKPKKEDYRPNWVIVGKLSQKGETILFKEKFSDWPESSRLIKPSNKTPGSINQVISIEGDLKPVELTKLLEISHPSVHINIDGKSVGRGGKWKVLEDGILREFSVLTKNVSMWHITDNEAVVVPETSMGQFFTCDAYIIRWDYELTTHGRYARSNRTGNLSSAFFFWQGLSTSITEKTASALLTIDLDKDRATQIRVKQHHESPAFCRLFDGSMIVYLGKQPSPPILSSISRLLIIRGEIESEAHFIEVSCQSESLRSRSVFLLLNGPHRRGFLWFGTYASDESKSCAHYCLKRLASKKPIDLGLDLADIKIEEIFQGKEPRTFWEDIGTIKRWKSSYDLKSLEPIRGWSASAVTGTFILTEIIYSLYPDVDNNIISAFPLLQSTMYKLSQPALVLIFTSSQIYIWEGWWIHASERTVSSNSENEINAEEECDLNSNKTVLPKNRIAAEKLALLKSVDFYLKQHENEFSASIIYAGLEPLAFQELFPFWEIYEDARDINLKRGHHLYQQDDVSDILDKYLNTKYSVAQLRQRPLPENVIPSRIESFLLDEEFEELFKMPKKEFYLLNHWKQQEKKKEVNLF